MNKLIHFKKKKFDSKSLLFKSTSLLVVMLITLGFSVSFQSLFAAWQAPTSGPPGNNIDPPLNTGTTTQTKSGSFNVVGSLGVGSGLAVSATTTISGKICWGGICKSDWEDVGSSGNLSWEEVY